MTLYIYDEGTMDVVAVAEGLTNEICEQKAHKYIGVDGYGATYTPAFGSVDGLIAGRFEPEKL